MHLENGVNGHRNGAVQRPARIESAHNAVTRGLHPNRANAEVPHQQQSQNLFQSSQYNDSNYQFRKASVPSHFRKEQPQESSGQGQTIGILSKVSGAQSTGTHPGNGLVINSSQLFNKQYYPHDSEKNSNADLIEHGLAGMHSMNTMHVSDQYRAVQQAELQRYQQTQQMKQQQAFSAARLQHLALMHKSGTKQNSEASRSGSQPDLLSGGYAQRYQTQPELKKAGPQRKRLLGRGTSPTSDLSGLGSERSLPYQKALQQQANSRRPVTGKQRGPPGGC